MRDLNGEIFARTIEGNSENEEWDEGQDEERMVLENWRLWGQSGSGFQQLQPKFYKCYVIKHGFMYIYPV